MIYEGQYVDIIFYRYTEDMVRELATQLRNLKIEPTLSVTCPMKLSNLFKPFCALCGKTKCVSLRRVSESQQRQLLGVQTPYTPKIVVVDTELKSAQLYQIPNLKF